MTRRCYVRITNALDRMPASPPSPVSFRLLRCARATATRRGAAASYWAPRARLCLRQLSLQRAFACAPRHPSMLLLKRRAPSRKRTRPNTPLPRARATDRQPPFFSPPPRLPCMKPFVAALSSRRRLTQKRSEARRNFLPGKTSGPGKPSHVNTELSSFFPKWLSPTDLADGQAAARRGVCVCAPCFCLVMQRRASSPMARIARHVATRSCDNGLVCDRPMAGSCWYI